MTRFSNFDYTFKRNKEFENRLQLELNLSQFEFIVLKSLIKKSIQDADFQFVKNMIIDENQLAIKSMYIKIKEHLKNQLNEVLMKWFNEALKSQCYRFINNSKRTVKTSVNVQVEDVKARQRKKSKKRSTTKSIKVENTIDESSNQNMSSSLDIKSSASIKNRVLYCVHERDLKELYSNLITIFDIIENLIDSQDEDLRNRVSLETYYEILRSARLLTNRFTQYLQVWMLEINKWFMIQNNDINFKTSIKS